MTLTGILKFGSRVVGFGAFATVAITTSMLVLSPPAKATPINDPAFVETLTNSCPANCASVALGMDPLSGKTTVEFIFNSTIPSVVAGDIKVTEFGSSTVGDVIRFENINSAAVAFIFSNDVGLPADVGLPSFQTNTTTIAENSAGFAGPFTPTSGLPGFCASCATAPTYALTSPDLVLEPGTLLLLGSGLLAGTFARRWKKKGAQA